MWKNVKNRHRSRPVKRFRFSGAQKWVQMGRWICKYRAVFCSLDCPKSENVVCFGLGEPLVLCAKSSQVATCKKIQIFGGPKVGSDGPLDMQISSRFLFIGMP